MKPFCNDSIDDKCHYFGYNCVVHKHRICDGRDDCSPTREDEKADICKDMEDVECVRRAGKVKYKIPSKWVEDGLQDCEDGIDENKEFWKKYREN